MVHLVVVALQSTIDTTFLTAQDFSNAIVDYSPYYYESNLDL